MSVQHKHKSHVSSKGQVVIPKALRDAKGIRAGHKVECVGHPEGVLVRLQTPKKFRMCDLVGCLTYVGPTVAEDDIKEAVDKAMHERWARKEGASRP
jgi:AbrB family looped-hinge helix DNA binding protein